MLGLLALVAVAGSADAQRCLRAPVWEAFTQGWGLRTATGSLLRPSTRRYLITLHAGNTYRVFACADRGEPALLLFSSRGELLAQQRADGPAAMLEVTPPKTGAFYVLTHLRGSTSLSKSTVAVAVTFKPSRLPPSRPPVRHHGTAPLVPAPRQRPLTSTGGPHLRGGSAPEPACDQIGGR